MKANSPSGDVTKHAPNSDTANQVAKTYQTPRLVVYGNLSQMTMVKSGTKADASPPPATRN